jgi:hypothetical protein
MAAHRPRRRARVQPHDQDDTASSWGCHRAALIIAWPATLVTGRWPRWPPRGGGPPCRRQGPIGPPRRSSRRRRSGGRHWPRRSGGSPRRSPATFSSTQVRPVHGGASHIRLRRPSDGSPATPSYPAVAMRDMERSSSFVGVTSRRWRQGERGPHEEHADRPRQARRPCRQAGVVRRSRPSLGQQCERGRPAVSRMQAMPLVALWDACAPRRPSAALGLQPDPASKLYTAARTAGCEP